jgi:hypothetical protein
MRENPQPKPWRRSQTGAPLHDIHGVGELSWRATKILGGGAEAPVSKAHEYSILGVKYFA